MNKTPRDISFNNKTVNQVEDSKVELSVNRKQKLD